MYNIYFQESGRLTNNEFALDLFENEAGLIAELETLGGKFALHEAFPFDVIVKSDVEELAEDRVRQVVLHDLVVFVEQNHRIAGERRRNFEELKGAKGIRG